MLHRATIQEIADKIAERFQTEQIILFGSYARGEAHEHSDVDLLVVVDSVAPRGRRSAPILKMLAEHYAEPIDVVVRSRQSLDDWQTVPGSFAAQVGKEGIMLYDRQEQPA